MDIPPQRMLNGPVLIAVPHMDDCVLACGSTLAKLPDKTDIQIVYATDGKASPAPVFPWRDKAPDDLEQVRMDEARRALSMLGVPTQNIHFLGLPDGKLGNYGEDLKRELLKLIAQVEPENILMPFRFDRHPDHLAINYVLTEAHDAGLFRSNLIEYFVYYHWRLLQTEDVRDYIRPDLLLRVEPGETAAEQKRTALDCFESQTTIYYSWQTRPNLTSAVLDEISQAPEMFLTYDPALPGTAVFTSTTAWIRVAHRLEPFIKKQKDLAVAMWKRGLQ
jgi:LmbE family N-acetylglucosaminyl deacetylase